MRTEGLGPLVLPGFPALWQLGANTVASFAWWQGRVLNTFLENDATLFNNYKGSVHYGASQQEKYLKRLQCDLIDTF